MQIEPVILEGTLVRLEPLDDGHHRELYRIGQSPEIWRWTTSVINSVEDMRDYVRDALAAQREGSALPFVTIDRPSGKIVGATRFGHIDRDNRRVEIGWTWITPDWQRTYINTEAKLLMLGHAFENWKCIRVEIITDVLNTRSRTAIRRLGATEEGVLRRHMIMKDGRIRDTVIHSIISEEWPQIKQKLIEKIESY